MSRFYILALGTYTRLLNDSTLKSPFKCKDTTFKYNCTIQKTLKAFKNS